VAQGLERFRTATSHLNLTIHVHQQSTHTAQEAADAVDAPVGAIVKSLIFMASGQPLLVLASGPNRVNQEALAELLGVVLEKADADKVKQATGYSIGGVPPFGHPTALWTVMDQDFFGYEKLWAAAGSASAVFPISPPELQALTSAAVVQIT
jgi:prolyl-tRNA editing enzyme YbaK/EbsC (Cys-tRNA(Pro) deacylase)